PYSARALAALGRWYEKEGDYAQALANYTRSLQSNQMQTEVAQRIAALQRAVGPTPLTTPAPSGAPAPPRTVSNPAGAAR
ncbi:MAG TPA: tetratricopeptide repeat protein, partial [Pirellulales bacterium]